MVKLKYYTDAGTLRLLDAATVEAAILKYRECRKRRAGANYGHYSIDDGKTWLRI